MLIFLMHICLLSFPMQSISLERTSELSLSKKLQSMKKFRTLRDASKENLDPGRMFASAVHLLDDIQPDLRRLSSSLSRKRSVPKPTFSPPDHLPNCKYENSSRCHRTRHMKRKHPHFVSKGKNYHPAKRKRKRTIAAVKDKAAHLREMAANHKNNNSTHKSFDYGDMIFTPTIVDDLTAASSRRGVFDSVFEFFAKKHTTLNPPSTKDGFLMDFELSPTEKKDEMPEPQSVGPQILQPRTSRNQTQQDIYYPQKFQFIRKQNFQPVNRNQPFQTPQVFNSNRNGFQQPDSQIQMQQPVPIPQEFNSNREQLKQFSNRNQIQQQVETPQVLIRKEYPQPSKRNEIQQIPKLFPSRQPIREESFTKTFEQSQRLQPIELSENKNLFFPEYYGRTDEYFGRNNKVNSRLSNDDTNTMESEQSKVFLKARMLPESISNEYQNDIDTDQSFTSVSPNASVESQNLITIHNNFGSESLSPFLGHEDGMNPVKNFGSGSSHALLQPQDNIKTAVQESERNVDTDLVKSNRAAQIHETHAGTLNRESNIDLELRNASLKADTRKAHLEQYLNYHNKRQILNNKVKEKSVNNVNRRKQSKEKHETQDQQFKTRGSTSSVLRDVSRREQSKGLNFYPKREYSEYHRLSVTEKTPEIFMEDNYEKENIIPQDPVKDAYPGELNYEEPPQYYY